jgi:hypothetical protein
MDLFAPYGGTLVGYWKAMADETEAKAGADDS